MIDIHITDNEISIRGHAGYAEHGKDIICAAVSVLADTLALSMKRLTKDIVTIDFGDGMMDIKFEGRSRRGKVLVDSFIVGVTAIADEYPDYVCVRDDGSRRAT